MLLAGAMIASTAPGADDRPGRFMPFLAAGAVVREEGAPTILAGGPQALAPTIVAGSDLDAGPRESFEERQIQAGERGGGGAAHLRGHPAGHAAESCPELATADAHGFLIARRGSDLHIIGRSGVGTLYGVWLFLQNYCGLRIVMPGELGEVYHRRESLQVPAELYVLNPGPAFLLRINSGTGEFDRSIGLQDFSGTERCEYHHNLWRIYDPARFRETHPEYYPIHNGTRYILAPSVTSVWQPTFSEPAVVDRAVEYADETFTADPSKKSISLTMNDGGGHSETDVQRAQAEGRRLTDICYDYVMARPTPLPGSTTCAWRCSPPPAGPTSPASAATPR